MDDDYPKTPMNMQYIPPYPYGDDQQDTESKTEELQDDGIEKPLLILPPGRRYPFQPVYEESEYKMELEHGINLEYTLHLHEVECGLCKKYFQVGEWVELLFPCRDVVHHQCSQEAFGGYPDGKNCPTCEKLIERFNIHKMRREGDSDTDDEVLPWHNPRAAAEKEAAAEETPTTSSPPPAE